MKNSKKDIYSDKNLYNEYIKQQSKIYKLYEKFLNELNTKNTNNYELAVFYHEFALLKEYLFDEYGAQKEYEKTLNYIKKIDLNKIDNISLQKDIKEFERHIKQKNEYFLYALE